MFSTMIHNTPIVVITKSLSLPVEKLVILADFGGEGGGGGGGGASRKHVMNLRSLRTTIV